LFLILFTSRVFAITISPLKITLKEPEQISLPFLIIEDPLVFIDTEVLWDESTNYQFELFKFYRYVNQKIQY